MFKKARHQKQFLSKQCRENHLHAECGFVAEALDLWMSVLALLPERLFLGLLLVM